MKLQKLQNSTYRSGGKNVKTNNCPVPDRARRASTINNLPTGFSSTGANSGIFCFRKVTYMANFQVITLILIDLLIIQGNLSSFDEFLDLKNAK